MGSKPSWKDVPSWVSWMAQDGSGTFAGYLNKPKHNTPPATGWIQSHGPYLELGRFEKPSSWKDTLEHRA